MPTITVSSREFTRDVAAAKRAAAEQGPVFITERGQQTHVLLTIRDFRRMSGQQPSLAAALAMPDANDVDFDPPRMDVQWQAPDFLADAKP